MRVLFHLSFPWPMEIASREPLGNTAACQIVQGFANTDPISDLPVGLYQAVQKLKYTSYA